MGKIYWRDSKQSRHSGIIEENRLLLLLSGQNQLSSWDSKARSVDIFDLRGIDRQRGAMIVVRPDQHVANVLPLDAYDALADFFGQFMRDQH